MDVLTVTTGCSTALLLATFLVAVAFSQTPPSLSWSRSPGAYEQHLQRRANNVLFPPNRRLVTQTDLAKAQARDEQDYEAVRERMIRLVESISQLRGSISSSQVNVFRKEMDDLVESALGVSGPAYRIESQVRELRETMMREWRTALSGNAEAIAAFDRAELSWRESAARMNTPFMVQMARADGPIPTQDVVPAILSEQPETITLVLNMIQNPELQGKIRTEALSILNEASKSGAQVEHLDEKLRALGIGTK